MDLLLKLELELEMLMRLVRRKGHWMGWECMEHSDDAFR